MKKKDMYNHANVIKEIKENRKEMQELREKMESFFETMEVLSDKRAMRSLAASDRDIKAGRVHKWSEIKKDFLGGK
ncbi:hypothetical protein HY989_04645 [Candidatus Micrarchaeota archaeon]|nr:hypothetical protein [Candidatus Micrarchaeota archaeon]